MSVLTHSLDRTLVIRAPRDLVFRYFTDSARWAAWWGAGSTIEPRVGGAVRIRYPDGTEVSGEVIEIDSPERLVFTYGYVTGAMIPPGGSRVTIRLEAHRDGTRLELTHQFADAPVRDLHVQGWRFQLSLFSNVVTNEVNAAAMATVDAWFAAWAIQDERARISALELIAATSIEVRDRFSALAGLDDLLPHIGAAIRFMPGIRFSRAGDVRHCQGFALVDWAATAADGQPRGAGTNVFAFGADGKITSVVGFWK